MFWESLGRFGSKQPVDAPLRRTTCWVMQAAHTHYRSGRRQYLSDAQYCLGFAATAATPTIAAAGGNAPKNSQIFSKFPKFSHKSRQKPYCRDKKFLITRNGKTCQTGQIGKYEIEFFHLAKYPPFLGAPRNSIKPLCRNCRK